MGETASRFPQESPYPTQTHFGPLICFNLVITSPSGVVVIWMFERPFDPACELCID